MNSLEQLNQYSSEPVDYGDESAFSISVTTSGDQVVSVTEEQSHQVPQSITINSLTSGPSSMYYEINLSNANGKATLSWPTATGVTFSNPSPNVYRATNVSSLLKWNAVKAPTIFLARDFANSFSYSATLNAGVGNVWSYNVGVNITDTPELAPLPPPAITYDEDFAKTFGAGNVVQIVDTATGGSYTITGTLSNASAGNLSSTTGSYTMSGGVFTATGDKTTVNTTLQGLVFTPTMNFDQSFSINWVLTNPVSNLQTTTTQVVNIGATNEEIINMGFNRSYSTNGYDLLFPTNVPAIQETIPGAIYTIQFETVNDIGEIHLGTNFASPTGWSSIDHTYTFTGTKAQCNTIFQTLRFFPYINISSNSQVIYRQSRDGTLTDTQIFNLNGTARNYIDGANSITLTEEQVYTDNVVVAPHWSQSYAVIYRTERPAGTTVTNVGTFTLPGGWSSGTGCIYRNFSAVNDVTTMISQIASAQSLQIELKPDYNTAFSLYRGIGIGSTTSNGSAFTGGTVYTDPMAVTITNTPEYTIPGSLTYIEDNNLTFSGFAVSDGASGKNYTVSTVLSTTAVGNLWYGNTNYAGNVTLSGTKSALTTNLNTIQFRPVSDGFANATIYYSQTQTTDGIVQAANVAIPLNSTGNIPEPIVGGFTLSTDNNSTNNQRSGFVVQQTITGAANAAILANSTTYSVGLVPNVTNQPVIQSAVKTQSGNDALLTLTGYWDNVKNTTPAYPPWQFTTSFPVTTTAVNDKNQITTSSFPVYTYIDFIYSEGTGPSEISSYGVISGNIVYYTSTFLLKHYSSGLVSPFKMWVSTDYATNPTPYNSISKIYITPYTANTNMNSWSSFITDPNADLPNTYGTAGMLFNSQASPYPFVVTSPSYNVSAPITPTSPLNLTPQVINQYFSVFVRYDQGVSSNPPQFNLTFRKQLANNLIASAGVSIYRRTS